jgi:hypothetical protein
MPYKYVAMWNLPGCLPTMEPAFFDNAVDAFAFMAEELQRAGEEFDSVGDNLASVPFFDAADECAGKAQSGVIGESDWEWLAPDAHSYSVTCQDIPPCPNCNSDNIGIAEDGDFECQNCGTIYAP